MARDAIYLGDVREPTVEILCEPCGRRGRNNVERLIAKHGADAKLPYLLVEPANCEKAHSASIYDRCRARCEKCQYLVIGPMGRNGVARDKRIRGRVSDDAPRHGLNQT